MASYRALRGDGLEMNSPTIGISPRALRSPSISSDVFSQSARSGITSTLPQASPQPAYIATSEASQLISQEAEENIDVTQPALDLLNSFLDHILYTLLSTAQSTKLPRLREIIPIVLKPRLGKAALLAADEELKEYLDDADEDALQNDTGRFEPKGDFDLDLAWKLARLRCMVYTRLGDMEEEDEEEYIEQDQLHEGRAANNRAVYRASTANAASYIFLTSILEYIGEQALLYAVQNTQRRFRVPKLQRTQQLNRNSSLEMLAQQMVVLDEADMFHVGRESPLSRLWRSWRRQTRSPMESSSRPLSPMSNSLPNGDSPAGSRKNSFVINPQTNSVAEMLNRTTAHDIPLPISANDVNEIEVPGLAREIVDADEHGPSIHVPPRSKRRPLSMVIDKTAFGSPSGSPVNNPTSTFATPARPYAAGRTRSISNPGPEKSLDKFHGNSPYVVGNPYDTGNEELQDIRSSTTDHKGENADLPDARNQNSSIVAKVASALGMGALATTIASQSHKTDPSSKPNTAKPTIADQMIGSASRIGPPSDAATGASITSVGDFDNLHLPVPNPKDSTNMSNSDVPRESSDPEDLALSSGGEDITPAEKDRSAKDATRAKSLKISGAAIPSKSEIDETGQLSNTAGERGTIFDKSKQMSPDNSAGIISDHTQDTSVEADENGILKQVEAAPPDVTLPTDSSQSIRNIASDGASTTDTAHVVGNDNIVHSAIFPDSRPGTSSSAIHNPIPPRTSSDRTTFKHRQAESKSSDYSQHSKSSSSSSKLLGFTRDPQGRPRPTSYYAAATEPFIEPQRSKHISLSSTKGVRQSDSPSKRGALRIATSSDEESAAEQAEAKRKSLDLLIRGDETLHYTLTPQSARAEHFHEGALSTQESELVDASQNSSRRDRAGVRRSNQSFASNSSMGINGLRANPSPRADSVAASSITRAKEAGFILAANKTVASSVTKNRGFHAQPRDAKLEHNTTRDLADYARSTGPENEQQLAKALGSRAAGSRPGTSATTKTYQSTPGRVEAGQEPPMPIDRSANMTTQIHSTKSSNRLRFQAREPTVARESGTNDLIKFIRDGPPGDRNGINGAIPQHAKHDNGKSSQASLVAPKSVQSSMNSRTALLESANRPQSRQINGGQNDALPARKQRRARDPYAIDDSDDDVEERRGGRSKIQDESLIDFLRNTAPTLEMSTPAPILGNGPAAPAPEVKRQPSNQGIRGRVMRSVSRNRSGSLLGRKNSLTASRQNIQANDDPPMYYRNPNAPREVSPHLVQTGKKSDVYKPTTSTHAPHVDRNRARNQPREARTGTAKGGTGDMADYLKNSGPTGGGGAQKNGAVKESGFMKFFSKRKATK